jgi:hypothetical protein
MQCSATTSTGTRCRNRASLGKKSCSVHQSAGGYKKKKSCRSSQCGGALSDRELKIIMETYNYYLEKFNTLPPVKRYLIENEVAQVKNAISNGDLRSAIELLTEIFNIASENGLISAKVKYPGPGKFKTLVQ